MFHLHQSCESLTVHKYKADSANISRALLLMAVLTPDCTVVGDTGFLFHSFTGFQGKRLRIGYVMVGEYFQI